jgi:hypothetical protein
MLDQNGDIRCGRHGEQVMLRRPRRKVVESRDANLSASDFEKRLAIYQQRHVMLRIDGAKFLQINRTPTFPIS